MERPVSLAAIPLRAIAPGKHAPSLPRGDSTPWRSAAAPQAVGFASDAAAGRALDRAATPAAGAARLERRAAVRTSSRLQISRRNRLIARLEAEHGPESLARSG
jgi:hypothetical protein